VVTVTGSLQDQEDISCVILWICATIRNPTYDGLALSGASITGLSQCEVGPLCMKIELLPLEVVAEERSCWHNLFTRAIVTPGFPIPRRKRGRGLEISFASMARLAACHNLVEYGGGLVAAGLVSVLLPVAMLVEDDYAIQWHFAERIDAAGGKEHSRPDSSTGTLGVLETMSRHVIRQWYKTQAPEDLTNRRAFVGWCAKSEVHLGTASAPFQILGLSSLPQASLERPHILSYSLSQHYTSNPLGQPISQLCVPPAGIARTIAAASNELLSRLTSLKAGPVVLYDAECRRGWLIPNTSLVLHMIHTYVTQRHLKVFSGKKEIALPYVSSQPDDGTASAQALIASLDLQVQDFKNAPTTSAISDLVQSIYLRMDLAADKLKQLSQMPLDASIPARSPLYGWEFMEMVNHPNVTTMKQQLVNGYWPAFTREINAVVLFGKGFQEVIRPARPTELCELWQSVPSGKDYLTTSVAVLHQMFERNSDVITRLSSKVHWNVPKEGIYCKCGSKCNHLQTLSVEPYEAGQLGLLKDMIDEYPKGAVIFGKKDEFRGDSKSKLLLRNKLQTASIPSPQCRRILLTHRTGVGRGR
jgi:hypothetical protein